MAKSESSKHKHARIKEGDPSAAPPREPGAADAAAKEKAREKAEKAERAKADEAARAQAKAEKVVAKAEKAKAEEAKAHEKAEKARAKAEKASAAPETEIHGRLLRAAKKLRPGAVIPCPADVRAAVEAAGRGLVAVFGEPGSPERKAHVAALRDALPELSIKKVLELPDLGRALVSPAAPPPGDEVEGLRDRLWTLLVRRHADLRVIGYYRFRDELDHHAPKLPAAAATPATGDAGERIATNGTLTRDR